jgi:hypothetical protein
MLLSDKGDCGIRSYPKRASQIGILTTAELRTQMEQEHAQQAGREDHLWKASRGLLTAELPPRAAQATCADSRRASPGLPFAPLLVGLACGRAASTVATTERRSGADSVRMRPKRPDEAEGDTLLSVVVGRREGISADAKGDGSSRTFAAPTAAAAPDAATQLAVASALCCTSGDLATNTPPSFGSSPARTLSHQAHINTALPGRFKIICLKTGDISAH